MRSSRRIAIVNADDFGLSQGVNRGIIEAHRHGILTSVSLLPNGPALEDAVREAKSCPEIGLGIHLCLVEGEPVLPPERVPSLVGPDGRFLSSPTRFLIQLVSGRISLDEVEAEWRAQIQRLLDCGLRLQKADSHMHLHLWPSLFDRFLRLCQAYRIRFIRLPREPLGALALRKPSHWALGTLAALHASKASVRGLRAADHFRGLWASGGLTTPRLLRLLAALPAGVTEIMTHPGIRDAIPAAWPASPRYDRQAELAALTSPSVQTLVAEAEIELATFGALSVAP